MLLAYIIYVLLTWLVSQLLHSRPNLVALPPMPAILEGNFAHVHRETARRYLARALEVGYFTTYHDGVPSYFSSL